MERAFVAAKEELVEVVCPRCEKKHQAAMPSAEIQALLCADSIPFERVCDDCRSKED